MTNFLRAVLCLLLASVAACSSYERRFAEASRRDTKPRLLEGAYSGRWVSASHPGGGGSLRCILTKVTGSESDYRADFHATWHGMSSSHTVVLHTKPAMGKGRMGFAAGERSFEGTSKLHTIIGAGTYFCKGQIHNDGGIPCMCACYDATYDKGTFQMTRVTPKSGVR